MAAPSNTKQLKISSKQLLLIGFLLMVINTIMAFIPHWNFFEGAWRTSNVDWLDVTYGSWLTLFLVWLYSENVT